MQNKPNFQKSQMNVNLYNTRDYQNKSNWTLGENKPNSNPISEKPKMNVNLYVIEDYENETAFRPKKTNPIQTQSKPVLSAVEWANFKRLRRAHLICLKTELAWAVLIF